MDRLTPLQRRILSILAGMAPPPTLTGGAALAILGSDRPTRDLDLFWRDRNGLDEILSIVVGRLCAGGLEITTLQTSPAFSRLSVADDTETVVVDLVAEPVPSIEPPRVTDWPGGALQVDSLHEILVNKLCSLLGRAEVRDLEDVRRLLAMGSDLPRALGDAWRKDAGFSPLTLAWVLRGLPVDRLAVASGLSTVYATELIEFKDDLIDRLVSLATPPSNGEF